MATNTTVLYLFNVWSTMGRQILFKTPKTMILEESDKLYNELITKLKNEVMANAAVRVSSLPLSHIITTETNP